MARTLLFSNSVPQSQTDPAYLTAMTAMSSAVMAGAKLHVSMTYIENGIPVFFYADLTAVKITPNYASGLLAMRPSISDGAQAVATNGMVVGSVDTLGNYVYGQYLFGVDTWGASNAPANKTATYPGYVINWFADT